MNKVILIGRLTRDVETRYSQSDKGSMAISRYTLAIDRKGKDAGADFINCVAFGINGDFAERYLSKGMKIAVHGRIQTGSYTDRESGKTIYTFDVVVEEHEFCESKQNNNPAPTYSARTATNGDGFMNIPDGIDEELPFN